MKRYGLKRAAAVAVVGAVSAFAPVALGGVEREAESIVADGLRELASQRERNELRASASCSADRDRLDAERARAVRELVDRILDDTEQRRADTGASPSALSALGFADAVSLGLLQDVESEEDLAEVGDPYQASIDHDADGDVDEGDLARAAQNPIAAFQNNTNIDFGNLNYEQNVLNIQPVIPINLNEDWNLVTRTIVPLIYQPAAFSGDDHDFGLGDIQFTPFFVPTRTFGGWMLGAGPVMRAPTATDERLGARKWALGPSAVAILLEGPWVVGSLFQQVWSLGGSGDRNVSEFLWQPFINYNIPEGKGWYLTTSPIITANWMADSDDTRCRGSTTWRSRPSSVTGRSGSSSSSCSRGDRVVPGC
ncbi:MAG: hypothetical protein ACYTGT_21380 [Planctomycetota bacterium]|jgi:hypothetical protein